MDQLREIYPVGTRRVEVPAPGRAQKDAVRVRRSLADMPAPPKQLNFISVVCLYTMVGLSERDIATALNCSIEQVESIKMLDAYQTVYDHVVKSIIDEDAEDIRAMFSAGARKAAKRVIALSEGALDEAVSLRASADILDRAGHRAADIVNVRQTLDTTLRIEYVEPVKAPEIDGEVISSD